MTGKEYIAKFLKAISIDNVFLVQGGACSFMVDAIAKENIKYTCFQHEQGAAMAADAVWRTTNRKKIGATFCTSGPGASNLVTGIACGYFDSIPSLHICGQVNGKEVGQYNGAKVRQAGFQQMDIVSMVKPISNYAVAVTNGEELRQELKTCYEKAFEGRGGPVLIDIPMDVQTDEMENSELLLPEVKTPSIEDSRLAELQNNIADFFKESKRPLVVYGAGVELAGVSEQLNEWLIDNCVPFVASWSALNSFEHSLPNYYGHFGVYGNRGANYIIQNADNILVLGSRLDNRQRSGNPKLFAPQSKVMVIDIDGEELVKYDSDWKKEILNLVHLPKVLDGYKLPEYSLEWVEYLKEMKEKYYNVDISTEPKKYKSLNPYEVVQKMNEIIDDDAMLFADAGANHVWVYQMFNRRKNQLLTTSSGHYAMGYSLPASIGAKLNNPDRQVISFNGDGGIQMNIQELQTMIEYDLGITVCVFNNYGLGMIRQFQNTYMGGRHEATGNGKGPGRPKFADIATAYSMDYLRVTSIDQVNESMFNRENKRLLIEFIIDDRVLIEPKLEGGRPINDQFPYVTNKEYAENNKFIDYARG